MIFRNRKLISRSSGTTNRQSLSRADPRAASLSRSALLDRARQSGIDADALEHLLAEVERARFAGGALPEDAEARVRALLAPVLS